MHVHSMCKSHIIICCCRGSGCCMYVLHKQARQVSELLIALFAGINPLDVITKMREMQEKLKVCTYLSILRRLAAGLTAA